MGAESVPRNIKAQRGDALRCKGWKQETILRMLENNLENGERSRGPHHLHVGAHRAARNWDDFDRIVATLKDLEADETLVVPVRQADRPVPQPSARAARDHGQRQRRGALGRQANCELEQKGLTITPGMTAAAWQYIGSQGILQGTYQSFVGRGADAYFGGSLRGRIILTAGCGGMGGAQPLAGKMAGAASSSSIRAARASSAASTPATSTDDRDLDEAVRLVERRRLRERRSPSVSSATWPTSTSACSRAASRPTSSPTRSPSIRSAATCPPA